MRNRKVLIAMFSLAVSLLANNVPVLASNDMCVHSEEASIEVANATYAIVNKNTTMYTSKYYQGNVVCSVPMGAIVEIRSQGTEWCRVKYNHQIGYVETSCLNFQW